MTRLERDDIERVYRDYRHSVLRRARQLLGNEQDSREILQEVFMSLIKNPTQFRGASSIATWLYSATVHLCLNRIRNQQTRTRILQQHTDTAATLGRAPAVPLDDMVAVRQLLVRLPPRLAQVAVYHYFDGMTQDEIAEIIGCSRRNIGKLLEQIALQSADLEAKAV